MLRVSVASTGRFLDEDEAWVLDALVATLNPLPRADLDGDDVLPAVVAAEVAVVDWAFTFE